MDVLTEKIGPVFLVTINRPQVKNAVDRKTAQLLAHAFRAFEADGEALVAVLWGAGGTFCAGADLKAVAADPVNRANNLFEDMDKDGPMGPSRMKLSKPVIAAVSGYAVAGGLELACWCDMRVVEEDAVFGVFCRRWGVPLIDGGTQRLPRLIGASRALDLILTGRPVEAPEAYEMGLANRLVSTGKAREEAINLARQIAAFPQKCMRSDRQALLEGLDMEFDQAMEREFQLGLKTVLAGETQEGATRFVDGKKKNKKKGGHQ